MAGKKKDVEESGSAFGDALIGALEEAVAFERGELPGVRVDRVEITARDARAEPPPNYTAARIRAIRKGLQLSQQVFADMLSASASAVRAWEQGAREPDGPSRRLLQVAETDPGALAKTLYGERIEQLRKQGWPLATAEHTTPFGTPLNDDEAPR